MKLYQLTFDCCTAYPEPQTEQLLKEIISYLTDYCWNIRKSIVSNSNPIPAYSQSWLKYRDSTSLLSTACDYLNRQLNHQTNNFKETTMDKLLRLSLRSVNSIN
jgi:hypothetical protein